MSKYQVLCWVSGHFSFLGIRSFHAYNRAGVLCYAENLTGDDGAPYNSIVWN